MGQKGYGQEGALRICQGMGQGLRIWSLMQPVHPPTLGEGNRDMAWRLQSAWAKRYPLASLPLAAKPKGAE